MPGPKLRKLRFQMIADIHGVTGILTFNGNDFRRYPGIEIWHPRDIELSWVGL